MEFIINNTGVVVLTDKNQPTNLSTFPFFQIDRDYLACYVIVEGNSNFYLALEDYDERLTSLYVENLAQDTKNDRTEFFAVTDESGFVRVVYEHGKCSFTRYTSETPYHYKDGNLILLEGTVKTIQNDERFLISVLKTLYPDYQSSFVLFDIFTFAEAGIKFQTKATLK